MSKRAVNRITYRSPVSVAIWPVFTAGISALVWYFKTNDEMNKLDSKTPTAWLLLVPFVGIWWIWKFSEGIEELTEGKTSKTTAFILLVVLSFIGMAILQNTFNAMYQHVVDGAPAHRDDDESKLERLHTLALKGVITQEEFQTKKRELLGL